MRAAYGSRRGGWARPACIGSCRESAVRRDTRDRAMGMPEWGRAAEARPHRSRLVAPGELIASQVTADDGLAHARGAWPGRDAGWCTGHGRRALVDGSQVRSAIRALATCEPLEGALPSAAGGLEPGFGRHRRSCERRGHAVRQLGDKAASVMLWQAKCCRAHVALPERHDKAPCNGMRRHRHATDRGADVVEPCAVAEQETLLRHPRIVAPSRPQR
jgi:hypothetical protein